MLGHSSDRHLIQTVLNYGLVADWPVVPDSRADGERGGKGVQPRSGA